MKHDGIKLIEWDFFCRRFTCENYHFLSLYSCLFKLHTPSLLIRPSIIIFCLRCCCFRICHFSSTILYLMRREVRINILTSLWKVQQKIEVTPGFDFFSLRCLQAQMDQVLLVTSVSGFHSIQHILQIPTICINFKLNLI